MRRAPTSRGKQPEDDEGVADMKALRILLVALAALAAGVSASGHAQTLLLTLDTPNPQAGAWFGYSLAMGDANGDGRADIAAGAAWENVSGNSMQGRTYVFSGADNSLLLTLDTPNPQAVAFFGYSLALGDVNGDGNADIAVGAPFEDVSNLDQGRVYVFSGANGSLLLTLDTPSPQWGSAFGYSLAMGDTNSDGKADIAVGAPTEEMGQGRAYVFSGADGSLLFTPDTPNPQPVWFGYSLALGDVNGDGNADIAVGAPFEDVSNLEQGRVYVFSGADASLLFILDTLNPQADAWFGYSLAVGDVNGDGKADIVVGQPGLFRWPPRYQGWAYVFSGANGSLLLTLDTPNPQPDGDFGVSVAVGDVNGDGKADIAVGAPWEDVTNNLEQGRAYVFSGADSSLLITLDTPNPRAGAGFGYSLALGDVNGDGKADIAVAAPFEDVTSNPGQGRAYVLSVASPNESPDCSAVVPSVAEIWPPNHKMIRVNILAVTDPDGDPISIVITGITQDEPVNGLGDSDTSPDGAGVGTNTAQVRAERAGTPKVPGNGRMYHIHFEASDGKSGACSGVVGVGVPHDQRPGYVIVDGGELYDSIVP